MFLFKIIDEGRGFAGSDLHAISNKGTADTGATGAGFTCGRQLLHVI